MKSRLLKILAALLGLAVFCLAGWALYRELAAREIRRSKTFDQVASCSTARP